MEIYSERGLGKLLKNHNISFKDNSRQDWKYKETAKLLWNQISIVLNFKRRIEELETDLQSLADNIANLYNQKENPVI